MTIKDLSIRISSKTSDEAHQSLQGRDESVNVPVAEHVDFEATRNRVGLQVLAQSSELDCVGSRAGNSFNVEHLSVSNEEPVSAEQAGRSLRLNVHGHSLELAHVVVVQLIVESQFLVAKTVAVLNSIAIIQHGSNIDWDKVPSISRFAIESLVALVESVFLQLLFVFFDLTRSFVKELGLSHIVLLERLQRLDDFLEGAFGELFCDFHGAEGVPLDVSLEVQGRSGGDENQKEGKNLHIHYNLTSWIFSNPSNFHINLYQL